MKTILEFLNEEFGVNAATISTLMCILHRDLDDDFTSDLESAIYSYYKHQLESEESK